MEDHILRANPQHPVDLKNVLRCAHVPGGYQFLRHPVEAAVLNIGSIKENVNIKGTRMTVSSRV